ncbi:MAG: hypothetical protein IPN68_09990 [Bacteroidetes bacterium]|nr:hypothetical protein [Bacteroidota bacterium]
MAIKVHPTKTGEVGVRDFDLGVLSTLGATPDTQGLFADSDFKKNIANFNAQDFCYKIVVPGSSGSGAVPVYFAQPDAPYRKKYFPLIVVSRDEFSPALQRWMSVGQLEYRAGEAGSYIVAGNGVSGFTQYMSKIQAMPYDFIYTISVFDRYENTIQPVLMKVLQSFPPVGKLFVKDSLGLQRTYEVYQEGGVSSQHEIVDAAQRIRGYSITIRVEGEIDLVTPVDRSAVTGFDLNLIRDDSI